MCKGVKYKDDTKLTNKLQTHRGTKKVTLRYYCQNNKNHQWPSLKKFTFSKEKLMWSRLHLSSLYLKLLESTKVKCKNLKMF